MFQRVEVALLREGTFRELAKKHDRPWLHVDLDKISSPDATQAIRTWIKGEDIQVLNVAGPRASKEPEIYDVVTQILKAALNSEGKHVR